MAERVVIDEDEERRQIVHKYEQGREKILDDIADWEDPTNEAYHVVDRYGFIHDYKLPEKLSKYESQVRDLEISRRDKWIKLLSNWSHYVKKEPKKLRRRIYKGIPNAVRGKAWCCLLGVDELQKQQEGKYEELWTFGKQHSTDVRQIDLDINRTFRNNQMFRERYNPKQQELFRVLVAYSVYNCEIGYCQGMSQIAALLLMFTSEEEAFWCMDRLMSHERYAMHGFFIPGFPKLTRFAKHHDLVLKKFLPRVGKHLKKFDIDSTLYTLKWFFQCFLDRVPFSLTLRIWDCFMLDGELILTCMSYTLLKLHKKTLLRKGMEDLIHFLQIELEKDFGYHDDEAIQALDESIQELKKRNMHLPREAASDLEKPCKPFGILLQTYDTLSMATEDRSVVGSIVLKPNNFDETVSIAATSRTNSEADLNDFDEASEVNFDEDCKRKLSVYDNVDLNESIEAAKRLSLRETANSPAVASNHSTEREKYFDRDSQANTSIETVEVRADVDEQRTVESKSIKCNDKPTISNNQQQLDIDKENVTTNSDSGDRIDRKESDHQLQELEEVTVSEDLNANDQCNSDKENRPLIKNGIFSNSIKTANGIEKENSTANSLPSVQSPTSPSNLETSFKRKTSIPKLKHNSKLVRPVGEIPTTELNAKASQLKSPVKTLAFKPMVSSNSNTTCTSTDNSVTVATTSNGSAFPSTSSPTSPGNKTSMIPRLQSMRSPTMSPPSCSKPTVAATIMKRTDHISATSPPLAQSPPESSSNAVNSSSLKRRLNAIKSNTNDESTESDLTTSTSINSKATPSDRLDSAKLRIYVPYVKHSTSNHGSIGNVSRSSNSSLHQNLTNSRTESANTPLNANAKLEDSNCVRINVNDDLKQKSYLPRIDT